MLDDQDVGQFKPVLGLFSDEAEFRDYLADNLHLIEPGLTLLGKEHALENPDGSGGRVDIVASDPHQHVVCIEIKRSNSSARSTLNELSKYTALLVEHDQLQQETIRCVVVSTEWKELLLPLSYFAHYAGVHVTALEAKREGETCALEPLALLKLEFLPQVCPDMDLIWFDTEEPRQRYVDFMKSRIVRLPFVKRKREFLRTFWH